MKVTNESWTVRKFSELRTRISLNPIYQRGPVWSEAAQQLLIDSILREFDIPKIYLWKIEGIDHDFEVADGQQRLRAIWRYLDGELRLGKESDETDWARRSFQELSDGNRAKITRYEIITAVCEAPASEIRELFMRLQRGMQLSQPEIRNAITSQLGDTIRAIAHNHGFFKGDKSPFSAKRRKPDDMVAHAFLLELANASKNLKAADLRGMYESYASGFDAAVEKKVYDTLGYLESMQLAHPKCIRTKWGFVDLYWVVSQTRAELPSPRDLANRYIKFEERRRRYVSRAETLLDIEVDKSMNRALYEYIEAFRLQGGLAHNVKKRHKILGAALLDT